MDLLLRFHAKSLIEFAIEEMYAVDFLGNQ
jgi:hypothetical protein